MRNYNEFGQHGYWSMNLCNSDIYQCGSQMIPL